MKKSLIFWHLYITYFIHTLYILDVLFVEGKKKLLKPFWVRFWFTHDLYWSDAICDQVESSLCLIGLDCLVFQRHVNACRVPVSRSALATHFTLTAAVLITVLESGVFICGKSFYLFLFVLFLSQRTNKQEPCNKKQVNFIINIII